MGLLRMQLLHPRSPTASSSSSSSTWAARLHAQSRPSFSCRPAITSAAARSSSSDDFNSRMAMSKGDLESCQWLKPTESKALGRDETPHRLSSSLSAAIERLLSPAGAPGSGSVQPPSNGSSHASTSKPSSGLLNAGPVARLLDATFPSSWAERAENRIERAIFDFRFLSLLAVAGSLAGSFLCFLKGCVFIVESYAAFYAMCLRGENTGKTVLRLVEAVDVYLTGTVMLIFGMGLYGLFISNVSSNLPPHEDRALKNSSLFGMFLLQERPKWMRIASLDELKTKVGHVVVMILLVKMFERSKAVIIATGTDLLSYSVSIFLTSGALLVLRHLHH